MKKKTLDELRASGLVQSASSFTTKPRKKLKARAKLKPGQQTQVEFFRIIWQEREHVSEISGLSLIPMPDDWEDEAHVRAWLSQFSHTLPKGAYPRYKARKDNIVLMTGSEHEFWEKNKGRAATAYLDTPVSKRVGWYAGWALCDRRYILLRDDANGITQS